MADCKLPLKKDDFSAFRFCITDANNRFICAIGHDGTKESKSIARHKTAFIVKACNAHAKLEEKAELLDRLSRLQNSTEFGSEIELAALMAAIKDLSL